MPFSTFISSKKFVSDTLSLLLIGNNRIHVGRWGLNKGTKAELVVKYANEDNCGCCGTMFSALNNKKSNGKDKFIEKMKEKQREMQFIPKRKHILSERKFIMPKESYSSGEWW